MLGAIEKGKVNTILVTELSRLSRSIKDFCVLWDFLKAHDSQFLSLREQFDTTSAAGEMMMFSIMNFAQFERKQTSERVSANFEARATRGLLNGGLPTLGYNLASEKKGTLTVNEQEAVHVRLIFELFQETGSLAKTVQCLNERGIATKQHRKKDGTLFGGKEWTLHTLWRVLRNRHYVGERAVSKKDKAKPEIVKASWPAIVSKEAFQEVQTLLDHNRLRYKPESQRTFDYFLSSFVFCPQCGKQLVGDSGKGKKGRKYVYYSHKEAAVGCTLVRVDAQKLHDLIRSRFKTLAKNEILLQQLYREADLQKVISKPEQEQRLQSLKKELRKFKSNASNLLDQIQNWKSGEVPSLLQERLQTLEVKMVKIESERENLEFEISASSENVVDATELFNFVKSIDKHFSKLTSSERRQFVRAFIGRVEPHPEVLRIKYNYSRDYVAAAAQVLETKSVSTNNKPQAVHRQVWGLDTIKNGSGGGSSNDPILTS